MFSSILLARFLNLDVSANILMCSIAQVWGECDSANLLPAWRWQLGCFCHCQVSRTVPFVANVQVSGLWSYNAGWLRFALIRVYFIGRWVYSVMWKCHVIQIHVWQAGAGYYKYSTTTVAVQAIRLLLLWPKNLQVEICDMPINYNH